MLRGAHLVTGGSRGIGRAVVESLVASGEQVAFTFRSDETAARDVESAAGGNARAYRLDLTDLEAADDLVPRVEEEVGPLHGLVNNAGIRTQGLLALTSNADWSAAIETNLGGVFRCCRAALRGMMHRRQGSIVNVASLGALHGVAGMTAYAASKAGAIGMTRSLAREVGKRGIRVNAVVPGYVQTDMTADVTDAAVAALRAGECLPGGVDVACVAATVRFLLSSEARSITGQCFVVDAGASA